ncbi:MAG: hypothetical protein MUE40_05100 [Anaerolineae bacterium]|nr:hypothetical protein [Anaerolineae bacterium]
MAAISAALRRAVVARAGKLCEYGQAAEIIVVRLEIDHMLAGWHPPRP